MPMDRDKINSILDNLTRQLLSERNPAGHWRGRLSGSALSTAVAVFALSSVDKLKYGSYINRGLAWLMQNANIDGGWGDTDRSLSNLSTTLLCWSALAAGEQSGRLLEISENAEKWISRRTGSLEPEMIVKAVNEKYKEDRTFSVPILAMCAMAGRLGPDGWKHLKPLPFELACLPHRFYKALRLPVVSYALPALIAMGRLIHFNRPTRNLLTRVIRELAVGKSDRLLADMQPDNGGFLEAAPLTGFVTASLAHMSLKEHPVVKKGVEFLTSSVRNDGSWPIDTDLATWLTTLSINALASGGSIERFLSEKDRNGLTQFLLEQQHLQEHVYTHAAPGGWAWTDAAGAVPDADDTACALIALHHLGGNSPQVIDSARAAAGWLMDIQNRDGGIPTFCKGWNRLPFDRSSAELTAHAFYALSLWKNRLDKKTASKIELFCQKALIYLENNQHEDGRWIPLWFGNQYANNSHNPVYGTSKVIIALCRSGILAGKQSSPVSDILLKAVEWLKNAQNQDGGWGGDAGVKSSVEETSLAVEAMSRAASFLPLEADEQAKNRLACESGIEWLVSAFENNSVKASPIGLYFAKLWYYEQLYPLIFSVSALPAAL
jgi:squalene-hopene/tetraprenyl-beta-curcumene cyclase